jgi:hypothetical protein
MLACSFECDGGVEVEIGVGGRSCRGRQQRNDERTGLLACSFELLGECVGVEARNFEG